MIDWTTAIQYILIEENSTTIYYIGDRRFSVHSPRQWILETLIEIDQTVSLNQIVETTE